MGLKPLLARLKKVMSFLSRIKVFFWGGMMDLFVVMHFDKEEEDFLEVDG